LELGVVFCLAILNFFCFHSEQIRGAYRVEFLQALASIDSPHPMQG
jgi:hypothetical protein